MRSITKLLTKPVLAALAAGYLIGRHWTLQRIGAKGGALL